MEEHLDKALEFIVKGNNVVEGGDMESSRTL